MRLGALEVVAVADGSVRCGPSGARGKTAAGWGERQKFASERPKVRCLCLAPAGVLTPKATDCAGVPRAEHPPDEFSSEIVPNWHVANRATSAVCAVVRRRGRHWAWDRREGRRRNKAAGRTQSTKATVFCAPTSARINCRRSSSSFSISSTDAGPALIVHGQWQRRRRTKAPTKGRHFDSLEALFVHFRAPLSSQVVSLMCVCRTNSRGGRAGRGWRQGRRRVCQASERVSSNNGHIIASVHLARRVGEAGGCWGNSWAGFGGQSWPSLASGAFNAPYH